MKKFILIMMVLLGTVSFAINVKRQIITSKVENREPLKEQSVFKLYEKAYFFTEFTDIGEKTEVYHIWSHIEDNGQAKQMAKIKLSVKGSRWRTWSSKNLWLSGTWMVEIIDSKGNFLAGKEFDVIKPKKVINADLEEKMDSNSKEDEIMSNN